MKYLALLLVLLSASAFGAAAPNKKLAAAIAADITAPTPPTNVTAHQVNGNHIALDWTAGTDNLGIDHYDINELNIIQGIIGSSLTTHWTHVGNELAGGTYTFTVSSVDAHGNVSLTSAPVSITLPNLPPVGGDTQAPTVPGDLSAISTSYGDAATVAWFPSTDNVGVLAYEIVIPEYPHETAWILWEGPSSYPDGYHRVQINGLIPGTAYTVRVRAYDAVGNYSAAAVASFTTLPAFNG